MSHHNAHYPSTEELVARARKGSDAFAPLYERLAPALFAWASLRIAPRVRARFAPEDLIQEVWWRILDGFDTYDAVKGPFRPWVFAIATRVLIDGMHRSRLGATVSGCRAARAPADATAVSRNVARDGVLQRVIAAVDDLDEIDQDIFVHCGLEGVSAPAAALLVGLSPDATLKRWHRLRERLRGLIPEGVALCVEP